MQSTALMGVLDSYADFNFGCGKVIKLHHCVDKI